MSVLTVVCISIVVSLYELPRLICKKQRKESIVFIVMLVIGVGMYAAAQSGLVPNPVYAMEIIYKPMDDWIKQWLH